MITASNSTPVFLLGAGRSGTKFLRSLLSASRDVNSIPFDVGYVWRYGNEVVTHDELTEDMLNNSIKRYVRKTLPKLVDHKHPDAHIYVEKSVPNTLRPAFMHAIFPEAKFIHLIRDGRAVTESAIRLWQEPSDKQYLMQKLKYFPWSNYRYAIWYLGNMIKGKLFSSRGQQIWGPRYNGMDGDANELLLETVCARQWKKCVEICTNQLQNVDRSNVLEVRYEQLMTDQQELRRIGGFLGLSDVESVIARFESTHNSTNLEKWRGTLSGNSLQVVMNEIEPTLSRFGYVD